MSYELVSYWSWCVVSGCGVGVSVGMFAPTSQARGALGFAVETSTFIIHHCSLRYCLPNIYLSVDVLCC